MTTVVAPPATSERPIDQKRARLGLLIWALMFFNGMAYTKLPIVLPMPSVVAQMATQAGLALATVLVLIFNRDRIVRPNLVLTLFSLLAITTLMTSVQTKFGLGTPFRTGRFCVFIAVLWLLTPLWGRRDRILLRWHMICLTVVLATVAIGFAIAPGKARSFDGRLSGALWPIQPTQVAHYAAVLAGILFVLLLAGEIRPRYAWMLGGSSVVILLLTHTRTALTGLLVGLVCATISLITVRRRARRMAVVGILVAVLAVTLFVPAISHWYSRGSTSQNVHQLNGRTKVWNALVAEPRSTFVELFGIGLTNKSFNGLPIDNSWYSTYQDEGLFGVAICVAIFLSLLLLAATRPRGPALAVAIFLIAYCIVASWTETGLGDVSPYILDLTVAAALIAIPADARRPAG